MNTSKYDRQVELQCPTCGSTQFSSENGSADESAIVTCGSCARSLSRADLMEANAENIDLHRNEVAEKIKKDITEELRKTLRDAFKNSKKITFR